MNEMDDTANNPLLEFSIKLCAAVKKEKCLHDRTSVRKSTTPDIETAWDRVAKEVNETIEYCKYRWKSMYKSFFRNYKGYNRYYLHNHMLFLKENEEQRDTMNDDTNSVDKFNDSHQESEIDRLIDDSDSQTASADEINVSTTVKNKKKLEMFLSDDNEENADEIESFGKRKRSNHRRACKRGLDPKLVQELADEESEEKRPRKLSEKTKSSPPLKDKGPVFKIDTRPVKVRLSNKILYTEPVERKQEDQKPFGPCKGSKMVDCSTSTSIEYCNASTQYEISDDSSNQLDDMFINTLRSQLSKMNGRQKLNFKSKVYYSLMEVFDDANDFPNSKEAVKVQSQGVPLLVNTTTGELRLMRELVALVQAAKSTPEIIKAKDKVSTTPLNKTPVKEKTPEGGFNFQISNVSSISLDDDDDVDLNIADNLEVEDDTTLPRSLDEIIAKPSDNRDPNKGNSVMGLPKHVLQKVVKVTGSNGSTIVARDGDKRRIYRIYPKSVNQLDNRMVITKNPNAVGTFYVAPSKSGTQAPNMHLNKTSNSSASISVKSFANKSGNVYTTSGGNNNSQNNYSTTNKRVNSPALYKSIHPANRILNASTGMFQEGSNANTPSPPPNRSNSGGKVGQISSTQSTGVRAGSTLTTTPKLVPIQSSMSMHPPKKPMQVRSSQQPPQILQRRFSICGPVSADKTNNSPNLMQTNSKVNNPSHSSISQIQISKPVSLNTQANNNTSPIRNTNNTATEQVQKPLLKSEPTTTNNIETPDVKPTEEAMTSKEPEEMPIIETAGTIEADSLDPLYVKQTTIKSEPVDD